MNEKAILGEIENLKYAGLELKMFFEIFNKNELVDLELNEALEMIDLIVKKNENAKILIFLIVVNRVKMISDQIKLFKESIRNNMSNKNNKVIIEFVILSEYIKNESIIDDLLNYYYTKSQEELNNGKEEFIFETLNNILKIPFFSINIIVEAFLNSKYSVSSFIIEEYIPFELQDNIFYNYLWISTLDNINKENSDFDNKYINFFRYLFKRMFMRGYCKNLCILFIDIINLNTYYGLKDKEFDVKKVFLNLNKLLTCNEDKKMIEKFILKLLKQLEEMNITIINERVVVIDLPDKNLTLNLLSAIVDYCIVNNGNEICTYTLFEEKLSLNLCITFLDISIFNILSRNYVEGNKFLKGEFDYMMYFKARMDKERKNENDGIIDVFCEKFIAYFEFYKNLLKTLLQKWELNCDSEKDSYNLSVLIIRLISIVLFIESSTNNLNKVVSELLLDQYKFVSNGMQLRLKSIDPIVRYSSMYLGEFYFNILTTLFPPNEQTDEKSGYLTTEENPKFDELNSLDDSIKRKHLFHLKHSTNTIIISNRNVNDKDIVIIHQEKTDGNMADDDSKEDNNELGNKELCDVRSKQNDYDNDDVFWDNAPSIKKKDSTKSNQISRLIFDQEDDRIIQSKIVINSYDLIAFYTDDKKSSQISNKEEILLKILNDLLLNIKWDRSNYEYIILPLVNKLISFNEKELRYTSLLVISKIIELKNNCITINIIDYACNIHNSIPMDTKILLLNSLILACKSLANHKEDDEKSKGNKHIVSCSLKRKKEKVIINLFDQYSLMWSSNLARYLVEIIEQSQGIQHEKVPNIFFITYLELFNNIILNTSINNIHTNQISTFGVEIIFQINTKENSLFHDPTIRKSLYILAFNIMQKCSNSFKGDRCTNNIVNEIINWLVKNGDFEKDNNCLEIINQIKSCVTFS
ncbi:hypothetical protein FG379_001957 [Cryptosporidium bovis]|uniref:uncharacterized protein n=1 Tax=Cryptosporidium bovis TaxID=310047 RepID=UPI00351A70E3|nr:hypothetical protein FG379_001957 [Cryptosporidium bovis]